MGTEHSIIRELEDAIQSGAKDKRVDTLRRVTDLFLHDSDRLNDQQIAVFDDVLGHLIQRIETQARVELSKRLAAVDNAPLEVTRRLAGDDDISVAGPILEQSKRLSANDLVEIARTKSQAHLHAISGRPQLAVSVTDVLLDRGDRTVRHRLAGNAGARFSDSGFATLVKHSEADDGLAGKVGLRFDIPLQLFRQLLSKATEAVKSLLLATADPGHQAEIKRILATISDEADEEANTALDYAGAQSLTLKMQKSGELNEAALLLFAKTKQYPEMIAALSLLCTVPIEMVERLLHSENPEVFLIPCKVANFIWPTVRAILRNRNAGCAISDQDLEGLKADYLRLSKVTAERVLRFWHIRQSAATNAPPSR
jgi:uncharacterized protein (DUF2336 family)